jgi:hypothetical protein
LRRTKEKKERKKEEKKGIWGN